jgi:hypothetical protein
MWERTPKGGPKMMQRGRIGALVVGLGLMAGAGQDLAAQDEVEDDDKIRVFFDCNAMGCFDLDYFRREITWVDWVRDREDSDVHVLVTMQSAGGGLSFEIAFIGRDGFEGQDHNLTAFSSSTDTQDEQRELLAARVKLGLAPYAAETSAASLLSLTYQDPDQAGGAQPAQVTPENDPWNLWVFNVSLGGSMSGESTFSNANVNASVNADRVSAEWKFTSRVNFNYRENEFDISDDLTITSFTRSMGASLLLVKSLGPRVGLGGRGNISSSSFSNQDIRVSLVPALEFNVFPYSESSRRLFTLQYRVGPEFVRYDETTVFGKDEEWLYRNALTAFLSAQQPWGSASFSLTGEAFLNDLSKNSLSVFGNVNLRIVRGLSLRLFASAARIRNRVNLAGSDASEQDILLRNRLLESSFSFNFNVGLSYRFGSIFNNIVNPRFGGGRFFFF